MFWFMGSEILIQGLLDPLLWLEERKFPGGRSVWWKLLTSRSLESREHQVRSGQIDSAEANDPFPPRNKHFPSSPPFSNVLFKFWTHHRINALSPDLIVSGKVFTNTPRGRGRGELYQSPVCISVQSSWWSRLIIVMYSLSVHWATWPNLSRNTFSGTLGRIFHQFAPVLIIPSWQTKLNITARTAIPKGKMEVTVLCPRHKIPEETTRDMTSPKCKSKVYFNSSHGRDLSWAPRHSRV